MILGPGSVWEAACVQGETSGSDSRRSGGSADGRLLRRSRHRTSERFNVWRVRGTDASRSAKSDTGAIVWIRKHRWSLEKKKAERLVYMMKTRSISVVLMSLALQLPGVLSSRNYIIAVGITAACVNWASEYFKQQIGSKGLSIMIGIRRYRWLVVVPWLLAAKQS